MNTLWVVGSIAGGGAIGFTAYAVALWLQRRNLSPVEKALLYQQLYGSREQRSLTDRFNILISRYGVSSSLRVALWGWGTTYVLVAVGLAGFGLSPVVALLAAAPASLAGLFAVLVRATGKREAMFERQMMTAMSLLAGQLESGAGLRRGIERVAEVVEDPLRGELDTLLRRLAAHTTMLDAFGLMAKRYPSPAMRLLISALEVDAASPGGKLAPVLRAIADGLEAQFRLASEGKAELAESRYQFWGILIGLAVIAVLFYNLGGESTKAAFHTMIAWVIMSVAGLNALFGIWRVTRLFKAAEGRRK